MKKIPANNPLENLSEFVGDNGSYEIIQTQDQSFTLKSRAFDEACHSLSGAYAETLHNYYQPCDIDQLASTKSRLTILEVGFGLGVGVQATFESLHKNPKAQALVHYVALELDASLIAFAQKFTPLEAASYPSFHDLKQDETNPGLYEASKNGHRLSVIVGNARQTLEAAFLERRFSPIDVIYQDAFSPRKNPELWTQEWFETLVRVSDKKVVMSTYCSSLSPRKAMKAAGFYLKSFKGLGKKRECTQASLSGPADAVIEAQLEKSQSIVLRDEFIESYRQK